MIDPFLNYSCTIYLHWLTGTVSWLWNRLPWWGRPKSSKNSSKGTSSLRGSGPNALNLPKDETIFIVSANFSCLLINSCSETALLFMWWWRVAKDLKASEITLDVTHDMNMAPRMKKMVFMLIFRRFQARLNYEILWDEYDFPFLLRRSQAIKKK